MELQQAQLAILDYPCDDLYYLAKAALETYDLLPANHEYKEWLLNCLVRCFTKVDFTEPGSEAFYESVKEAWNYLDGQMQGQGKPDINVSLIGSYPHRRGLALETTPYQRKSSPLLLHSKPSDGEISGIPVFADPAPAL